MEDIKFLKLINKQRYEEIKGIYCIKASFNCNDNVFLFSKIIIQTSEFLIFTAIKDTCEIKIELKSHYTFPTNKKIMEYDKYNGQKVFDVKKCINHMGCYDQYSIAIGSFNTSFSIICDFLLGIFESNPLIFE